jgi:hypothetical protein
MIMLSTGLAIFASSFRGLAFFLQKPVVFAVMALTGSVILILMAFGMFRALPSLRLILPGIH